MFDNHDSFAYLEFCSFCLLQYPNVINVVLSAPKSPPVFSEVDDDDRDPDFVVLPSASSSSDDEDEEQVAKAASKPSTVRRASRAKRQGAAANKGVKRKTRGCSTGKRMPMQCPYCKADEVTGVVPGYVNVDSYSQNPSRSNRTGH